MAMPPRTIAAMASSPSKPPRTPGTARPGPPLGRTEPVSVMVFMEVLVSDSEV
jgi:hypothetical protein